MSNDDDRFVEAMTATAEGILAIPGEEESKAKWARVYAEERRQREELATKVERHRNAAKFAGLVRTLRSGAPSDAQLKLAQKLAREVA